MSFGIFLQIFANVVFTAALFVVFARLRRPAKDDPRLSKGLQLLSSKIAVLEDLSDRTETQVQQMLLLLDQKSKELQSKIGLAEQQVGLVRQSMQQSLEVAQIFQDKIPHSEIIERQNSVKYIKAARMAHAGASVSEIALQVDLPVGEIEFIAKVNHESLSFREEELPAWAREPEKAVTAAAKTSETGLAAHVAHENLAASLMPQFIEQMPVPGVNDGTFASAEDASFAPSAASLPSLASDAPEGLVDRLNKLQFDMKNLDLELAHRSARNILPDTTQAFTQPRVESTSLERLGQEFRRAVEQAEQAEQAGDTRSFAETFAQNFSRYELHASAPQAALAASKASTSIASVTPAAAATNGPLMAPAQTVGVSQAAPAANTIARNVSIPELEAARAAAAALRTPDEAPQRTSANKEIKSVRRVEFPRI